MKKFLLLLLLTIIPLICGCGKKIEKPILFEDYRITLATKYNYKEIKANIIPEVSIIKQYVQDVQTGFAGSIIIAKTKTQEKIDIDKLAENNAKSMTKKITGIKKPTTNKLHIKCKEQEIDGFIQKISIKEGKENQYINQMFFSQEDSLYAISTMTTNKDETKNLFKSIKSISCLE